jgi:hemolysin activation/secretion protein
VEFNNFQSPTVGAERVLATIADENFLGLGDPVRVTYGESDGLKLLLDISYALPVTPWDTQLGFQFRKNDFQVVESPFDDLNIETNTEIYTLSLRHPVIRTLTREISLSIIGEHLKTKNFLLGIPFSFVPGTTSDGKTKISSLRLGQEWVERRPTRVFAARSRFSIGLDVLDATINDGSVPDGQFFAWLGQFQAAQRIDPWAIQLIGRMDFQVANDRLFPLEQYAIGGRYSVRGYRTNQLVRDNAFLFTVESRIPIFQSALKGDSIHLAPFIDVGRSWRAKDLPSEQEALQRSETKTLPVLAWGCGPRSFRTGSKAMSIGGKP